MGDPEPNAVRNPVDFASVVVRLTTTAATVDAIPLTPRTWNVSEAPAATASAEGAPTRDNRGNRGPRDNKPGEGGRPPRERERFQGKGKGPFKGGDKGREGRGNDRGGATRPFATSAAPRERDRPIDPNSPFAKLAALKEQLSGRKD